MKSFRELTEAKATYCGRCGTTHVPPSKGGTCPALNKEETDLDEAIKIGTKVRIHAPGKSYHDKTGHVGEIRHGLYKGAPKTYTVDYDGQSVQLDKKNVKMHKEETQPQGEPMSTMEQYLAAIEGNDDFRSGLDEKKLTPAEMKKREEVAKAIERENPGMDKSKKMAIATATAKRVAEDTEQVEEGKQHTVPKTEREKDLAAAAEPKGKITHKDVLVKRGVLAKEAMISYSDFMDKLSAHRKAGNKIVDDKYTEKKATYTTIDKEGVGKKITHTPTGSKQEHLGNMKGDDDQAEVKTTEKRGRGRPAGSKSGARH